MNVAELLARVQARGQTIDPDWAMRALGSGLAQYMPVGKHSGVMGYLMADGTAVIYAAAGSLSELLGCLPGLAAFYRRAGAEQLAVYGRKGWRPFLERRGWRLEGDGMIKDLRP
jgi:hypothetical protein